MGTADAVRVELESRSGYMRQVVADRARFAPMILDLAAQIAEFAPADMHQLCAFLAEVERRLSLLSDERMVLKADNFVGVWPERRLEALREAAARQRELAQAEEAMDPAHPAWAARPTVRDELRHAAERFEAASGAVERFQREQEDLKRRYAAERIPFDFAAVRRAQLRAVELAKYAMTVLLASHDLLCQSGVQPELAAAQVEGLAEAAMRFAFRCHQFAGGFDSEADTLFGRLQALLP